MDFEYLTERELLTTYGGDNPYPENEAAENAGYAIGWAVGFLAATVVGTVDSAVDIIAKIL